MCVVYSECVCSFWITRLLTNSSAPLERAMSGVCVCVSTTTEIWAAVFELMQLESGVQYRERHRYEPQSDKSDIKISLSHTHIPLRGSSWLLGSIWLSSVSMERETQVMDICLISAGTLLHFLSSDSATTGCVPNPSIFIRIDCVVWNTVYTSRYRRS